MFSLFRRWQWSAHKWLSIFPGERFSVERWIGLNRFLKYYYRYSSRRSRAVRPFRSHAVGSGGIVSPYTGVFDRLVTQTIVV